MKVLIVLSCVLVAVLADDKYTDKYDKINLQEILENKRLLESYMDCVLGKGKCTPEGKELKGLLFDIRAEYCKRNNDFYFFKRKVYYSTRYG